MVVSSENLGACRKFRELWPLPDLTERASNVAATAPNLVARMPVTKCYSSCYSLLRVLGAFPVGWCRTMSGAV
jgi:hypothetical protein